MRKSIASAVAGFLAVSVAGTASANCWNTCVLYNPISGSCVKEVKVCDVENPAKAAQSLGTDIYDASNRLRHGWQNVWGEVPGPLRDVLEHHPISIIAIIYLDTPAYALAIGAIETWAERAQARDNDSKQVVDSSADQEKEWKRRAMVDGEAVLLFIEGLDVGTADYTGNNPPNLPKYDGVWQQFRQCVIGSHQPAQAENCVQTLRHEANNL